MDYCDIEWFALEMNRDHSVFEIAPNYCILDSLVDSLVDYMWWFISGLSSFTLDYVSLFITVP